MESVICESNTEGVINLVSLAMKQQSQDLNYESSKLKAAIQRSIDNCVQYPLNPDGNKIEGCLPTVDGMRLHQEIETVLSMA